MSRSWGGALCGTLGSSAHRPGASTRARTPPPPSHPALARRLEDDKVSMRAEAEAPFRSLRLVLWGFNVASASVGTLISLPQLAAALGGAPNALAVEDVLQVRQAPPRARHRCGPQTCYSA